MIGKLLFEEENNALRKKLSNIGVSGKLKAVKRDLDKKHGRLFLDNILESLGKTEQIPAENQSPEPLVYSLIYWILVIPRLETAMDFHLTEVTWNSILVCKKLSDR